MFLLISEDVGMITAFAGLLIGVFVIIFYMRNKLFKERVKSFQTQNELLQRELAQEKQLSLSFHQEKTHLLQTITQLETEYKNLRVRYDEHNENHQSMQEKFENLAQKILNEKTQKFDKQHKEGIKEILEPLKEKIKHFEERVERTHKEGLEKHYALKEQISGLKDLNEKMTNEANSLARALRGDSKTQGNWGELILDSILEKSGLQKDREYFVQESHSIGGGKSLRPDVVIHLPANKCLIIDSKVSLKAYDLFVNSLDDFEKKTALKAHGLSIKQHIDSLSLKNYQQLYQMESPDFVLMFVPIDSAFSAALSVQTDMYAYAFDKNVVIVTPSTLLATLKTVDSMWRNEKQQKYALEIASEAGKMYDKFVSFVGDLESLGKRIDQTKDAYQDTLRKLTYGKGDLITRAQKIKTLGAKTTKNLNSDRLITREKKE